MTERWRVIFFLKSPKSPFDLLKEELLRKSRLKKSIAPESGRLSKEERILLETIRIKTAEWNKNNITRTKAYLDFFLQHPEIHWAFLAHMVSRNAGWNMSDLKGELLTRLLPGKEMKSFFAFLERGNWLIFQDAYPQLLLYAESLEKQRPYFYLFSHFNISIFMETVWNYFWTNHDRYVLTMALVINEQNYLENRVIKNPQYQKNVLEKIEFKLQDLFSLSHILFPYGDKRLIGQTLNQFDSLHKRIQLGKKLYRILFQKRSRFNLVLEWAKKTPHTGSRKDYWPDVFNSVNEGIPGFPYQLRLKSCGLRPGAARIYSPVLGNAWKDVTHEEAEKGDWFHDTGMMEYLIEDDTEYDGEIKNEYCKTLERLELAALAKKAISLLE